MTIKSVYEFELDRMVLHLGTDDDMVVFLLRRQWLNLIFNLNQYAKNKKLKLRKLEDKKIKRPMPIRRKEKSQLNSKLKGVEAIRFKSGADSLGIVFTAEGKNVALTLNDNQLVDFFDMLSTQSERAGWDAEAALKRLEVEVVARKAIQDAKNKS